ncbi:MAG: glutathione S-transferase family protein [Myxococcota bacterium]
MADRYRIYGSELSPYSVKVRSCFRYKKIPHTWILRNPDSEAEYQKYAKIPLIPLVVTPGDEGLQDSTPIVEHMESRHPDPPIHPADPVAAFVSVLLEEFGDEWGNKWMFHYRWAREVDQTSAAGRIARSMMPGTDEEQHAGMIEMIRSRMLDRLWFVGVNDQTAPVIEDSFREAIAQLNEHLAGRPYLFGARPAFGDFGLWGQLYNAWTDPTAGALIEGRAPQLLAWIQRMLWPRAEGGFESWEQLAETMAPFLARQVGRFFMPWTVANAAAIAGGRDEFTVALAGRSWTQKPQKYHAKSLQALRSKAAALPARDAIDPVLERAGCLAGLRG